jgi:thiol-disulfide isomerase/thioredoxin
LLAALLVWWRGLQSGVVPDGRAPSSAGTSLMDMGADNRAVPVAMPRVGQPLPSLDLIDISGQRITNETLRGNVVLLDVWASWCGPCKEEMPGFEKLHQRYSEQGLRVIGVSIDMTADDAESFARKMGVSYAIVHRPGIMSEWGLLGLPTTFIVDRAGIIRRIVIGFEYADSFERSIRELLG